MATEKLVRIMNRIDTKYNWETINPTLAKGEIGLEEDTNKIKIGDNSTKWNDLNYITIDTCVTNNFSNDISLNKTMVKVGKTESFDTGMTFTKDDIAEFRVIDDTVSNTAKINVKFSNRINSLIKDHFSNDLYKNDIANVKIQVDIKDNTAGSTKKYSGTLNFGLTKTDSDNGYIQEFFSDIGFRCTDVTSVIYSFKIEPIVFVNGTEYTYSLTPLETDNSTIFIDGLRLYIDSIPVIEDMAKDTVKSYDIKDIVKTRNVENGATIDFVCNETQTSILCVFGSYSKKITATYSDSNITFSPSYITCNDNCILPENLDIEKYLKSESFKVAKIDGTIIDVPTDSINPDGDKYCINMTKELFTALNYELPTEKQPSVVKTVYLKLIKNTSFDPEEDIIFKYDNKFPIGIKTELSVVDNCKSESSSKILSAKQGKILYDIAVLKAGKIVGENCGEIFNDYSLNKADGIYSHTEGCENLSYGNYSHSEGYNNKTGLFGFLITNVDIENKKITLDNIEGLETGDKCSYSGNKAGVDDDFEGDRLSHDFGTISDIDINNKIIIVDKIEISSSNQIEENGYIFIANKPNIGTSYIAGTNSHTEGYKNNSIGFSSHTEGTNTKSLGYSSHAEGSKTISRGRFSHTEGWSTEADGRCSHSEGMYSMASGNYSHAEGSNTDASGENSHAEGSASIASGQTAHSEGSGTTASGYASHAEGNNTIASSDCQHVQGKFNIKDIGDKYAHIIGNGANNTERSNAHTLDWLGNSWYQGNIKIGGTSYDDTNAKEIATQEYVDNKLNTKELIATTCPYRLIYKQSTGFKMTQVNNTINFDKKIKMNISGSINIGFKYHTSLDKSNTSNKISILIYKNGEQYSSKELDNYGKVSTDTYNESSATQSPYIPIDVNTDDIITIKFYCNSNNWGALNDMYIYASEVDTSSVEIINFEEKENK